LSCTFPLNTEEVSSLDALVNAPELSYLAYREALPRAYISFVCSGLLVDELKADVFVPGPGQCEKVLWETAATLPDAVVQCFAYGIRHFKWNGKPYAVAAFDGKAILLSPTKADHKSLVDAVKAKIGRVARRIRCGGHMRIVSVRNREVSDLSWDDIIIPDAVKAKLERTMRRFLSGEAYGLFNSLGANFSCDILLAGPSGCGKTLLAQVLSDVYQLPLVIAKCPLMLPLSAAYAEARAIAPCILLVEDAHKFIDRDTIGSSMVSDSTSGVLTVATTENLGQLTPELINSPVRFDSIILLPLPDAEQRAEYIRQVGQKAGLELADSQLRLYASKTEGLSFSSLRQLVLLASTYVLYDQTGVDEALEEALYVIQIHKRLSEEAQRYEKQLRGDWLTDEDTASERDAAER
jgi:AAA+ superfamily predicted ATPase